MLAAEDFVASQATAQRPWAQQPTPHSSPSLDSGKIFLTPSFPIPAIPWAESVFEAAVCRPSYKKTTKRDDCRGPPWIDFCVLAENPDGRQNYLVAVQKK